MTAHWFKTAILTWLDKNSQFANKKPVEIRSCVAPLCGIFVRIEQIKSERNTNEKQWRNDEWLTSSLSNMEEKLFNELRYSDEPIVIRSWKIWHKNENTFEDDFSPIRDNVLIKCL